MAVDRGGLQYTIEVINQFSVPLRQFQTEIRANRQSFNIFKRDVRGLGADARAATAGIRQLATTSRRLNIANRQAAASSRANAQALRSQAASLRTAAGVQRSVISARQASTTSIQQQTAALNAQRIVLTRTAVAQRRLGRSGRAAADGIDRASASAVRGRAAFGGLLLTFRRLVTTLIFFEAARFALEGIRSLVGGTIEFASALEQATLGVATLLTALGGIDDSTGLALQGIEALTAAEQISENQLRQLRVEALQTAATFDQLAQTFQVAIAPGVTGGLNLDQIRRVTVQISQAAAAIGLAQNELNEEVRSLLQGTISQRFTRIATALFITNKDIRRARESGRLFEFLQERLEAFSTAGARSLLTFQARVTNATDALFQLSSTGAASFFGKISDALADATQSAINLNTETQQIQLNPELVRVFEILFDSLARSVDQARALATSLDFEDLASAAVVIASTVDAITGIFVGVFEGAVKGGEDLLLIFRTIFATIANITGLDLLDPETLGTAQNLLTTFVRIFVAFKGIQLAAFAVTTNLGIIVGLGLIIAASLNSAAGSGQELADSLTGIRESSLTGLFDVLALEASTVIQNLLVRFGTLVNFLRLAFRTVAKQIGLSLVQGIFGPALTTALTALGEVLQALAGSDLVPDSVNAGAKALLGSVEKLAAATQLQGDLQSRITRELKKQTLAVVAQEEAQIAINDLALQAALSAARLRETLRGAGELSVEDQSFFDDLGDGAEETAERIKKIFTDLGLVIPQSLADGLKELKKSFNTDLPKFVGDGAEKAEQRFTEKFFDRIRENLKNFDAFDEFFSFLENATRKLTDLIADLIVDAFDPNTDESAKERFLTFLRELAREAIRILLRIALAKIAATVFGPEGQEAAAAIQGGAQGAQKGRFLTPELNSFDRKARQAIFDFDVGFAGGGKIGGNGMPGRSAAGTASLVRRMRPSGLDSRDTIPIWTQPQEWVIRRSSALKYGSEVMDAINRGLIDPFALKSLAGARPSVIRRKARSMTTRMGFQTGGAVGSTVATPVPSATGAGGGRVVGAVLVPNEQTMDRLLAGGPNSMLEFFADNAATINGILSV